MKRYVRIHLKSQKDAQVFNNLCMKQGFEIDLQGVSSRYVIDAKSIMGIFSLDLSKDLTVIIHASEEESEEFVKSLSDFIVESEI